MGAGERELRLSTANLLSTVLGIHTVLDLPEIDRKAGIKWLSNMDSSLSLSEWRSLVESLFQERQALCASILLGVSLTSLREGFRTSHVVSAGALELIWCDIRTAVNVCTFSGQQLMVPAGAHGSFMVPLCTVAGGTNDHEAFWVSVWLPDAGQDARTVPAEASQTINWVLAGNARCQGAPNPRSWYSTFNIFRCLSNLTRLVLGQGAGAIEGQSAGGLRDSYSRNMVYTRNTRSSCPIEIPAGSAYATLVYGKVLDLPSRDQNSATSSLSAVMLIDVVNSLRAYEAAMEQGNDHAQKAEWEHSIKAFENAFHQCQSAAAPLLLKPYRHEAADYLGFSYRCLGMYEKARLVLESELPTIESSSATQNRSELVLE